RRSEYDLAKAEARAHVLEGLLVALDNLDEVISTIRRSRTAETARNNLIKSFKLSEIQAQAILDMPLRRLAALERKKIQEEYKDLLATIKDLQELLASPQRMRQTVRNELDIVLDTYGDQRKTQIVDMLDSDVSVPTDLIPDQETWVMVGEKGTVARSSSTQATRLAGQLDDPPLALLQANTQDFLYLFAANGEAVCLPVHQLPQGMAYGEGTHWAELTPFTRRQHVVAALVIPREAEGYVTLATLAGMVKRVRLDDLPGLTSEPFVVMRVDKSDSLGWAILTSGEDEILLSTAVGQSIRFKEDDVRPMGLPAGGVMGIKLKNDTDGVVAMQVVQPEAMVWTIADNGFAKATPMSEYPTQGRNGQGVINMRLPKEALEIVSVLVVDEESQLYLKMTTGAVKSCSLSKTKQGSRAIKPEEIVSVGPRRRVAGALLLRARPEDMLPEAETEVPTAEQLALLS
ncbi:MAG: hypothetical protein KDD89_02875, partial [Anaerolineales bacterium]|nr:hypothetical protein [Anaerolineales bacterium]